MSSIFSLTLEFSLTSATEDSMTLLSSLIELISMLKSCTGLFSLTPSKFESSVSMNSSFSDLAKAYAAVTDAAAAAAAGD